MNERIAENGGDAAEGVAENAREEWGVAVIEMLEANEDNRLTRITVSGDSREAIGTAIETLLASPRPWDVVGKPIRGEPFVDPYEETFLRDLRSVLADCSEFMGEEGPASGCPGALALADRAEAMLAQVVAWPDDRRSIQPRFEKPSKPLGALAHSLRCMADQAREGGHGGWAVIAARAAGFVAAVENSVTRLLPAGTEVRHPDHAGALSVVALQCFDNGRLRVIASPGSGSLATFSFALDEIEPIFELKVARFEGSLHHGLDRDGEEKIREFIGQEQAAEPTVHHLAVDPDQRVTIHGFDRASPNGDHSALVTRDALTGQITGIEYGCGDDEFPS